MEIGENAGPYFDAGDEFKTAISEQALKELIRQYKLCCRLEKSASSLGARSLCPHELAEAKQYQMRRMHLELFLRILHADTKDYDIEAIAEGFGEKIEDWSLILRDRISD
ncbi:hypothetical protein ACLBW0_08480 [Enterobacteriaceae bacterium C34A]